MTVLLIAGLGLVAGGVARAALEAWLRRPLTPTDRYCSWADDELTRRGQ